MIGAIAGDIIGSPYEFNNVFAKEFPLFSTASRFTDDSVLSIAVADVILHGGDYSLAFREYYRRYPNAGYGGMFHTWARSPGTGAYNSFGNGSAMRVGAVPFAFESLDEVLSEAERTAAVTHNHPEGVKGAQAAAAATFLARKGEDKDAIRRFAERELCYDLGATLDDLRPYAFDETCQGTLPQALIAFLESDGFEDAVRNAVSIGGDSDTLACIAGGIAHAFYGVPEEIERDALATLDEPLRAVVLEFKERYL